MSGRSSRAVAAGALATGLAVALGACSPGSPTAPLSGQTTTTTRGPVPMSLTVWDQESTAPLDGVEQRLDAGFQRAYPNVTVHRRKVSFTNLKAAIQNAPAASRPDVVEVNQGHSDMGALVQARLLRPLDSYAKVFDWTNRFPAGLRAQNSFSSDGKSFGTGSLYGVSQTGEMVGLFYDKAKLAALHLSMPKLWSGFEKQLPTIAAAGEQPIVFGNRDAFPAISLFGLLHDQSAGPAAARNLVFGGSGAHFDSAAVLTAAQTLQGWERNGYLSPGADGLSYEQAATDFAHGTGVYLITGTWEAATLAATMGANVGFVAPPPVTATGASTTSGGQGLAWTLTASSAHPDVAAAYLDYMTGPDAAQALVHAGELPATTSSAAVPAAGTVALDVMSAWQAVCRADGVVPYLDYSTPTMFRPLSAGLTGLIAGRATPTQFVASVQRAYATHPTSR